MKLIGDTAIHEQFGQFRSQTRTPLFRTNMFDLQTYGLLDWEIFRRLGRTLASRLKETVNDLNQ